MREKDACALLKTRFEKAGFEIEENVAFDEDGIACELDGFDAGRRVGYEYVTEEAGDGWDVDSDVVKALEARRESGLFILVVGEADAPDAAALGRAADLFLGQLEPKPKTAAPKNKATAAAKKKSPAKKKK